MKIPKDIQALYHDCRKNIRIKECIYPDNRKCNEVIGAHSIQNEKILKKLSENGIVFMGDFKSDFSHEFGRGEASVFTSFCGFHDKVVFQPIEDFNFKGSVEQIFLYTYRAFAYCYYKKKEELLFFLNLYKHPKCIKIGKWLAISEVISRSLALRSFEEEKAFFDDAILSNDYNVLSYLVWTFDGEANFASVGHEAMPLDFEGNKIQDIISPVEAARNIYISVFPEAGKTYAIISCLNISSNIYKTVFDRLFTLSNEEQRNFINNTIPFYTNNCAFKPSFYRSFTDDLFNEFETIYKEIQQLEIEGKSFNWFKKPKFDLLPSY